MTKFTKTEVKECETVCTNLQSAFSDLQKACEIYNDAKSENKAEAKASVEEALRNYNDKVEAAKDLCQTFAEKIREYIDGKSEKWQEGDKCTSYEAWAEEWENVELGEITWDQLKTEGFLYTSDCENWDEVISGFSTEVQE